MKPLPLIALFSTSLVFGAFANDGAEHSAESKEKHEKHKQMMLKNFDKNGDGVLNESEKAEMKKAKAEREPKREEHAKKFDADGDGKPPKEEREGAHKARHAEMLK